MTIKRNKGDGRGRNVCRLCYVSSDVVEPKPHPVLMGPFDQGNFGSPRAAAYEVTNVHPVMRSMRIRSSMCLTSSPFFCD